MRWRHRTGALLVMIGLLVGLPTAAVAAAPAEGCDLITASELHRVLGVGLTSEPVGKSNCYWLSEDPGIAEVAVTADRSRTAADIKVGKRSLRKETGATVLKGIGDLAILTPAPTTSPADVTTLALVVFVGTDFGQLSVTLSEIAPTTKQMRHLGKILAARL